jgi:hypothetical protein
MTNNILSSFPVHIVEGVHSLTAQRKLVNIIQYYSREILAFVVCLFFFFRFDQIWKKIRSPSLFLPCSQIVLAAAAYFTPACVIWMRIRNLCKRLIWKEKRTFPICSFCFSLSRREKKCSPKFVPRGSQHHLVDIKRKKEGENIYPSGVSSLSLRNQSTVNRRKAMQFRAGIWRRSSGCWPPISYIRLLLLRSTVYST